MGGGEGGAIQGGSRGFWGICVNMTMNLRCFVPREGRKEAWQGKPLNSFFPPPPALSQAPKQTAPPWGAPWTPGAGEHPPLAPTPPASPSDPTASSTSVPHRTGGLESSNGFSIPVVGSGPASISAGGETALGPAPPLPSPETLDKSDPSAIQCPHL